MACLFPALAGASTLKIATLAPDGTAWMKHMRVAGTEISDRTQGRVRLKFYPGGVMGNAATVRRKMRIGQLQGGSFLVGNFIDVVPDLSLYSLPFLFSDQQEVDAVRRHLDSELVAAMAAKGYQVLGLAGAGFAYLMSDSSIATIDDLRGKKIWVPQNDTVAIKVFRHLGITPIPLNLSDVYTSLQTGLIDTVANTPTGAIALQWYTQVHFVVDTPVEYALGLLVVDGRAFRKLQQADRAVIRDVIGQVFDHMNTDSLKNNQDARQALVAEGLKFVVPSAKDLAQLRSIAVQAVQNEQGGAHAFSADRLARIYRLVEEYRATR